MIAVTCSACHLRFEAPAQPGGSGGTDIMCPACDAGAPVVLDFSSVTASKSGRIKVAAPPMDPFFAPEAPSAAAPAPLPVYVDFDEPVPPKTWSVAGPTASIACLTLLAVGLTWQSGTFSLPDVQVAFDRATERVSPVTTAAVSNDNLATGSIAKSATADLRIERVATELAETDEGRVLTVRTDIRNSGFDAVSAPRLRISIRDADGTILHRWKSEPQTATIEPGETRAFTATTMRIPAGAGDVKVDFATR